MYKKVHRVLSRSDEDTAFEGEFVKSACRQTRFYCPESTMSPECYTRLLASQIARERNFGSWKFALRRRCWMDRMPRTCLACASTERAAIDKALVNGEPLRNISKRVSISPAGLVRHKSHLAGTIAGNISDPLYEDLVTYLIQDQTIDFVLEEATGLGPTTAEHLSAKLVGANRYLDMDPPTQRTLLPSGDDEFIERMYFGSFKITRDAQGKVEGLVTRYGNTKFVARRLEPSN